jgi:hypothetical protein
LPPSGFRARPALASVWRLVSSSVPISPASYQP